MSPINDFTCYTTGMQKSLEDKLFWLTPDITDSIDSVVDFGCADGSLLKYVSEKFPGLFLHGYDIDSTMVRKARRNVPQANIVQGTPGSAPTEHTLFNCSSVIHEVYSYGAPIDIEDFWYNMFHAGYEYIAIRDMCVSSATVRPASLLDKFLIGFAADPDQLNDFVFNWGAINHQDTLIHFLLKYRYTANWQREVQENYLPLTLEELLSHIPANYQIVRSEHYTLPFLKQQVYKDFGIVLTDPTHIKLLLRKDKHG